MLINLKTLFCLSYLKKFYGLTKYFFQDDFAKSRFWTFIFVHFSKSQKSLGKNANYFTYSIYQKGLKSRPKEKRRPQKGRPFPYIHLYTLCRIYTLVG